MEISLRLPLRQIQVTQPFGVNYLNFYQQWGLKGHNGTDFKAMDGFKFYFAHGGQVTFAGLYSDGCRAVEVWHPVLKIKTCFLHLKSIRVKVGDLVLAGQEGGECDNTGLYTTGDHLHFGMKFTDEKGNTINYDNGYRGAVDPTPYFKKTYNGIDISPKDYDQSNAYHRYYRGRPKGGLINEAKVLAILTKKGIRPSAEKINALVYGGWDLEAVQNPAMYTLWGYLKKAEYLAGMRPFQN